MMIKEYMKLPKSVLILVLATIINCMGKFVAPFLTLILSSYLGLDVSVVGTILTVSSVIGIVGIVIGGKLTDTIGRKKVLVVFGLLSVAMYIIAGFFIHKAYILIACIWMFDLFNSITQPVSNTVIMDVTTPEQRTAAFSLQYLGINIGFAAGPIIGGLLYNVYLPILFFLDAITLLLSVLICIKYIKETKPENTDAYEGEEKSESGSLIGALIKRPELIIFIFGNILFFFVFAQYSFALPLSVENIFGQYKASEMYGLIISANAIVVLICTIPFGRIFKRFSVLKKMAFAGLFYAIGFGFYGISKTMVALILCTAIWTFGEILCSTQTNVYIASKTPASHRGRFNALFPLIRKAGQGLSPVVGGFLLTRISLNVFWSVVALVALLAGGTMLAIELYERKRNEKAGCVLNAADN